MRRALVVTLALAAIATHAMAADAPAGGGPRNLLITYRSEPANRPAFRAYLQGEGRKRLEELARERVLETYQILFNPFVGSGTWDAMAVLTFANYSDTARWRDIERSAPGGLTPKGLRLAKPVDSYWADLTWSGATEDAGEARDSVYYVIPYEYAAADQYRRYVDDYVIPQVRGWMREGVLAGYRIFMNRFPVGKPWDALFVYQYRDLEAFGRRDEVVTRVRQTLVDDPQWKQLNAIKQTIRTESENTIAESLTPAPRSTTGPTTGSTTGPPRVPVPPTDCEALVGYDRDLVLPGYLLPTKAGAATCVPFTTPAARPPPGYRGDFYVDEFTDAKLRARWVACKQDKTCYDRVFKQVMARHPPNAEYGITDPHIRYLLGKVNERPDLDLGELRRPGFFAAAPYNEPIASADSQTYTVEFTAPPDAYERLHRQMTADIKLRGWYIRGDGVRRDAGEAGASARALVIMSGGGGDRIAAIEDPADHSYSIDPKTGKASLNKFPNATSGAAGQTAWRQIAFRLHEAGFDVLLFDRRGIGMSGGFSDTNTLQQGRDLLQIIGSLRTGAGMRALSPKGETTLGREAAVAVRGGEARDGLPVLLLGSSRGTMASGWAMTINFDKDCSYDLPTIQCGPPVKDPTLRGAMLIAEFSSGVGYLPAETTPVDDGRGPGRDRGLFIGGIEVENNIVFFPSSAILAGIGKWPSAFFARGLWCYASSLEGSMESYSRVQGLKDLVVVRAPHPYETWPAEEKLRMQERMLAYARAVVLGHASIPGRRSWSNLKELVATTSDVWEPSTRPTVKQESAAATDRAR